MSDGSYHFGSVVELNLGDDATLAEIRCAQLQAHAGLPCQEVEIGPQASPVAPQHGDYLPAAAVTTTVVLALALCWAARR